jgi:hypothetical protein
VANGAEPLAVGKASSVGARSRIPIESNEVFDACGAGLPDDRSATELARRSLRRQSALIVVVAPIRRIHPEREFHLIASGTRAAVSAEAVGDIAAAVTHVEVPAPQRPLSYPVGCAVASGLARRSVKTSGFANIPAPGCRGPIVQHPGTVRIAINDAAIIASCSGIAPCCSHRAVSVFCSLNDANHLSRICGVIDRCFKIWKRRLPYDSFASGLARRLVAARSHSY